MDKISPVSDFYSFLGDLLLMTQLSKLTTNGANGVAAIQNSSMAEYQQLMDMIKSSACRIHIAP